MSLLATLALVLSLQEPSTPTQPGVAWLDDLDEARAIAAESNRPLLVVFR
jgi:hypothetical protein